MNVGVRVRLKMYCQFGIEVEDLAVQLGDDATVARAASCSVGEAV
jgi:hypothetical protein